MRAFLVAAAIAGTLAGAVVADEPRAAAAGGARLNPSVLLFHKPFQTSGVEAVRRAAELGCRRVNVVATMLAEIDEQNRVLRYGYFERGRFRPLDQHGLDRFGEALRETFAEAVRHDMDLAVLVHLNAGGQRYEWRNHFRFDPLAFYEGFSYHDSVLGTVVGALRDTAGPTTRVELAVAGEMGRSVFSYPDEYRRIVEQLKRSGGLEHLEVGVSFNFTDVADGLEPTAGRRAALERLMAACDFVGMSQYRWFDLPVDREDFEGAVAEFLASMAAAGAAVPAGKPLHFSEVGIGGGDAEGRPTSSPQVAAKTPWQGTIDLDRSPWRDEAMHGPPVCLPPGPVGLPQPSG